MITLFVVGFQIASLPHLHHVWTTLATAMNTMLMPVLTSNPGPWTTADNSVASVVCIAINLYLIILVFSVRLLSVLRGHFIPATTANDRRLRWIFYPRFYPLHLLSYLIS